MFTQTSELVCKVLRLIKTFFLTLGIANDFSAKHFPIWCRRRFILCLFCIQNINKCYLLPAFPQSQREGEKNFVSCAVNWGKCGRFGCAWWEINNFHPLSLFQSLFTHHRRIVISWPDMLISDEKCRASVGLFGIRRALRKTFDWVSVNHRKAFASWELLWNLARRNFYLLKVKPIKAWMKLPKKSRSKAW